MRIKKIAYVVEEDGSKVSKVLGGKVKDNRFKCIAVPLFEKNCKIEFTFTEIKDQKNQDIINLYFNKVTILEEEKKLFKKIEKYLKNSKGIFIIHTDLQVLPCNTYEKELIGFSLYEQVGVAVFQK